MIHACNIFTYGHAAVKSAAKIKEPSLEMKKIQ